MDRRENAGTSGEENRGRLPRGFVPRTISTCGECVTRYNKRPVPKYSIVVPLHNEQENVTDLYDRLKAVMEAAGETFEIVLVDDGSNDHTFAMLREIAAVDSRVTVVKLRRNFGQTAGLAAGFDHARGEYIIAMDGDLQHDPADIRCFWKRFRPVTTSSAAGAKFASIISGCAASLPAWRTG
jgi:glycosyltransferase involved in cell wall biosynthesis